jgi:hypothetical protein
VGELVEDDGHDPADEDGPDQWIVEIDGGKHGAGKIREPAAMGKWMTNPKPEIRNPNLRDKCGERV